MGNIISKQEAMERHWLDEPYLSNKFFERYNKLQKYINGEEGGEPFIALKNETFPINLWETDFRFADFTTANLKYVNMMGAHIDIVSLLKQTDKLEGIVLSDASLYDIRWEPLSNGDAISIFKERMSDLNITSFIFTKTFVPSEQFSPEEP